MRGKKIVCWNCFFDFWFVWINTGENFKMNFAEITAETIVCDQVINVSEFDIHFTSFNPYYNEIQILFCVCRNCSLEVYKIISKANGFDSPRVARFFLVKR